MPEQKPSLFTRIKNDWKSLPPIAKTAIKVAGFVAAGAAIAIVGVATLGAAPALAVAGFAVAAGVTFAAGGYKAFKNDATKTPANQVQQASSSRGQSQGISNEQDFIMSTNPMFKTPAQTVEGRVASATQTANLYGVDPLRAAVQKTGGNTPHNSQRASTREAKKVLRGR